MSGRMKWFLILAVAIAGLMLLNNWRESVPRTKDESRLPQGDGPVSVTERQSGKVMSGKAIDDRLPGVADPAKKGESVEREVEPGRLRREAMAVENVMLAHGSCGIELTAVAREMIARDKAEVPRPFADERSILATLWRETFACNRDYAGENCFAARWQICQRAYEEYGPNGIRLKGLIKAIVKK